MGDTSMIAFYNSVKWNRMTELCSLHCLIRGSGLVSSWREQRGTIKFWCRSRSAQTKEITHLEGIES